MVFEEGHLYHVYNQGNNRQKIFFSTENYLFFLNKIRKHIQPHADILAWCLMPNHFHLMIYVHTLVFADVTTIEGVGTSGGAYTTHLMTPSRTSGGATMSRTPTIDDLNKSIGILLASYTRAINKQQNKTGSLFRDKTKSECLTKIDGITPAFYGSEINVRIPEKEYPQVCFNYIHQNPVKSGLVKNAEDWEFSSYRDYIGLRDGSLINRVRCAEFVSF